MADHRTHPTGLAGAIPEADLLEQQTPVADEPLDDQPDTQVTFDPLVDDADYLDQAIPVAEDDGYPHTTPAGEADG